MKHLITCILFCFCFAVMAAEPSYTCTAEQGCREEPGPEFDISRGVKISLPPGWRVFSYPQAKLAIMEGLREIRAVKDDMIIAVTPIPNITKKIFSQEELCAYVNKASGQYLTKSKEKTITTQPISHENLIGCYATLTTETEGERPFTVLPNRHHSSVTTLLISYNHILFSVSVVSGNPVDEDYLSAIKSVSQMH